MSPLSLDHIMVYSLRTLYLLTAPHNPSGSYGTALLVPLPYSVNDHSKARGARCARPLRYGNLGQNRVELLTPSLSEKCSNRLSYWPQLYKEGRAGRVRDGVSDRFGSASLRKRLSRRKEVIQPHLPVRLPCYDFTLLMKRTFDVALHCWLN